MDNNMSIQNGRSLNIPFKIPCFSGKSDQDIDQHLTRFNALCADRGLNAEEKAKWLVK